MYFFIDEIEFEMLDDDGNPTEITDEESEKIGKYISKIVWESDNMKQLVEKIESIFKCKIGHMTFETSPVMPR